MSTDEHGDELTPFRFWLLGRFMQFSCVLTSGIVTFYLFRYWTTGRHSDGTDDLTSSMVYQIGKWIDSLVHVPDWAWTSILVLGPPLASCGIVRLRSLIAFSGFGLLAGAIIGTFWYSDLIALYWAEATLGCLFFVIVWAPLAHRRPRQAAQYGSL